MDLAGARRPEKDSRCIASSRRDVRSPLVCRLIPCVDHGTVPRPWQSHGARWSERPTGARAGVGRRRASWLGAVEGVESGGDIWLIRLAGKSIRPSIQRDVSRRWAGRPIYQDGRGVANPAEVGPHDCPSRRLLRPHAFFT